MRKIGVSRRGLYLLFSVLSCFLLTGCGSGGNNKNELTIDVGGFSLECIGNVKLSKVALKTDDLYDIIDLYQEEGENLGYRDSLLIAQKYSQGLGISAFAQENLDVLEDQGLTLSNINKKRVPIKKDGKEISAILLEYEITEGLITEIPLLYLSQLFIPDGNTVLLTSFVTENLSSRNSVSSCFKKIK